MENNDLLVELPDASGNFSIKKDPPAHSSTYSSYGSSSNGYGAGGAAENAVVSTVPPVSGGLLAGCCGRPRQGWGQGWGHANTRKRRALAHSCGIAHNLAHERTDASEDAGALMPALALSLSVSLGLFRSLSLGLSLSLSHCAHEDTDSPP